MKYKPFKGDNWLELADEQYFMCCDCSLVHRLEVRKKNGKREFKMTRDERRTAAARRKKAPRRKAI